MVPGVQQMVSNEGLSRHRLLFDALFDIAVAI